MMSNTLFNKLFATLANALYMRVSGSSDITLAQVNYLSSTISEFIDENYVPINRKVDLPHDLLVLIAKDSVTCRQEALATRKISCIKHLRTMTGASLKASKDAVEEAFAWDSALDALREKLLGPDQYN